MSTPKNDMENRLACLRSELKKAGAAAFLCTACDPHGSEYISDHYKVAEYLSGFTGENATLFVNMDEALLWTDSRFFIQGERELSGNPVTLMKSGEEGVPTVYEQLSSTLAKGDKLLVDLSCVDGQMRKKLRETCGEKSFELLDDEGIADRIWPDRPPVLAYPVEIADDDIYGGSIEEKLAALREKMSEKKIGEYFESRLDNLMWLFNLRGRDIPYNTLAFAHGRITDSEAVVYLYDGAVSDALRKHLFSKGVEVRRYDEFKRPKEDPADLISSLKACKTDAQIRNIRKYFEEDSKAVTDFLAFVKNELEKNGELTEKSAALYLHERRKQIDGFMGESFETISAYGANAALPHYSSGSSEEDVKIKKRSFYLCDSGGLYPGVTTDVTRTIACGELSDEERRAYTLVVAGWVRLMNAVWREGCTGQNLDILARERLWQAGLDYGHGTGHGVGAGLCVHEGPQSISYRSRGEAVELKPGMLVTCEPGYYKDGPMSEDDERGFGIRIENTLLVVKAEKEGFLKFEPLTLVPIDLTALDRELLTDEESRLIDEYHELVRQRLG